jgi:eukaryotic-like serine/threonine-protein kinase
MGNGEQMTQEADSLQEAVKGRYLLERELGRGGMGIVFLARDVALERPVAIKLLPPSLSVLPGIRLRFLQEARTAAGLSHPNIVPIHAVEEAGDFVWFVMSYVPGETLAERVGREGPLPVPAVARMVQEVAWALAYAHQHGVIHRDVKPENILLERGTDRALVADFGIARLADESGISPSGEMLGTPRLVSPEQAGGEPLDGRSDLYSLGVTAFFALTGRYPFEGDEVGQLLAQHLTMPAPPVASLRRGLPAPLAVAIDRCLAKSPEDRFANGEALAAAIAEARPAEPVPRILQQLTREISSLGVDIVSFGSLVAVALTTLALTSDFFGFGYVYTVGLALALAAITGIRGIAIARLTREAIREGWEKGDLIAAAEQEARESPEEVAPPRLGRRAALYGAGMVATLLYWLGPKQWGLQNADTLLGVLIELVALAAPVALGRWMGAALETPRGGKPGLLSRFFLRFKSGLFFKSLGGGRPEAQHRLALPNQPTEMHLANQARDLLHALPPGDREGLGDVSGAIARLESDADRLRVRLAVIDQTIGEVGPGAGDRAALIGELRDEREAITRQLATAVSALEGIRLDLLRLRAGVGTRSGLTTSIEQLRHISAGVDAVLEIKRTL